MRNFVVMKVDISRIYTILLDNFAQQRLFPYDLFIAWDAIEIEESALESGYNIYSVLCSPEKSPYFWHGYKGIRHNMPFYSLCFFAFYSGVMYAIIKNNQLKHWSYWDMHKRLGSDFLLECIILETAIKNRNAQQIDIIKGSMDVEGVQMFSLVQWIINNYFTSIGIANFKILDENNNPLENLPITNIDSVLSVFHRFGCACFSIAKYDGDDCRMRNKQIWGGTGMAQIFNFMR